MYSDVTSWSAMLRKVLTGYKPALSRDRLSYSTTLSTSRDPASEHWHTLDDPGPPPHGPEQQDKRRYE